MKKFYVAFTLAFILYSSVVVNAQLTTTISGVVWVDQVPLNGLRDLSETKLPGILVELYDTSTDLVVSSAISAPNGAFTLNTTGGTYYIKYVFPADGFSYAAFRAGSDKTVNSSADPSTEQSETFTVTNGSSNSNYGLGLVVKLNTRTHCDSKELTVTNWTKTFSLPKSTPDVSKLLSAKLFLTEAVYHPTLGVENTNATDVTPTVEYKGRVTLTLPNLNGVNTTTWITETLLSKEIPLGPYDNNSDYDGTSGKSFSNEFASASNLRLYTATAAKNLFTGTDEISFPATTTSVSSIIGAANLQFVISTHAAAGVCVVYTYQDGTLPVNLLSFSAKSSDSNTSRLQWATTEETNSDRFDIQKSHDGKQWSTIGSVKSRGESKDLVQYTFDDKYPTNGENLYRLKLIDLDDSFAFSRIASVRFEGLPSYFSVYPNPATSQLSIQNVGNEELTKVQVFNQAGQLLKTSSANQLDVSQFANGIYSITAFYSSGAVQKNKIVVSH